MASNSNRSKTVLSDVLYLFTTRYEDPLTLSYEVECATLSSVTFTLNFEGSENFRVLKNDESGSTTSAEMRLTAKIRPFGRVELGKVMIIDMDRRASLRLGCSWAMEDPDQGEVDRYLRTHHAEMNKLINETKKLKFPSSREDPNNQLVIEICNNYGKSFIDRDFLPNESSLHSTTNKPESSAGADDAQVETKANSTSRPSSPRNNKGSRPGSPRRSKKNAGPSNAVLSVYRNIEWRRPHEFMNGEIKVFDHGIQPGDIRQGQLGDCWFLSALSALAEFPVLVEALFTSESKEYQRSGVYNIRFCKNGLWVTIRVDDYFPCFPASGPIFSRSNGNELWVLLVEKAYAKLHGSYDAIRSGWAYEAMVDLTGAPCKSFRLDDPLMKVKIDNGELWSELLRYDLENYLMSASTPGEDEINITGKRQKNSMGLIAGHSYTIISAKLTSKGDKLLKIRNPWGSIEWNGDWSDSSPLWTEEMQNEIEPLTRADDGIFWMSFEDVIKHFSSINICLLRYPGLHKKPWKELRKKFSFDFDRITADQLDSLPGDENMIIDEFRILCSMFLLTLHERSTIIVSIHQQDKRCQDSQPYIDIGVTILKTDPIYGTFQLVTGSGNSADRQQQTDDIELEPGKYLIIPTTSGCKLRQYMESYGLLPPATSAASMKNDKKQPTTQGNTTARLPLTKPGNNASSSGGGKYDFTDDVYRVYTELFTRMDIDNDGYLNKMKLINICYVLKVHPSNQLPINGYYIILKIVIVLVYH
mmetsp:Transcript_16055/g.17391  ORF Transcript_16055/g.17391 Transcript_16055/m.17391 type:complete len:757 (-) Transcript_16055:897-3167(-)